MHWFVLLKGLNPTKLVVFFRTIDVCSGFEDVRAENWLNHVKPMLTALFNSLSLSPHLYLKPVQIVIECH